MNVTVLGVGLVGGSIGLAAKARTDAQVTGFDPDEDTLQRALMLGAIDQPAEDIGQACAGADVVICAGPLDSLEAAISQAIDASSGDCVVTDVGSVKAPLAARFASEARFVGGHPLAGIEGVGVDRARADLFEGARWFLTPEGETEGVSFDRLQRLISELGARPQAIEPAEHDRLMARVSHLPHLLANVLLERASGSGEDGRLPEIGPSFRDATRVAGENPPLWADIYLRNAEAVATEAEEAADLLRGVAEVIRSGDREQLEKWQERAGDRRRDLLDRDLERGPLVEVRVLVPNRPGVVAEIALELGKVGVNIEDMALYPASDMSSGAISLFVSGADDAQRALECLQGLGHEAVKITR